ncbi:MAG TPA: hypothetical protein VIK14_09830 [Ignavibacteria bacterium]
MKNKISKLVFLIILIFATFNLLNAQNDNLKKYQKLLKAKITEKLNISDSLADKYFEFFNQSREGIKKLNKEKIEIIQSIEDNPESSDISTKIDRLLEIDQLIENYKKEYFNNLKTIFSPSQIAKSIIFQKNLRQFLKKEIKKKSNKRD